MALSTDVLHTLQAPYRHPTDPTHTLSTPLYAHTLVWAPLCAGEIYTLPLMHTLQHAGVLR